jgi:hypothetical protein
MVVCPRNQPVQNGLQPLAATRFLFLSRPAFSPCPHLENDADFLLELEHRALFGGEFGHAHAHNRRHGLGVGQSVERHLMFGGSEGPLQAPDGRLNRNALTGSAIDLPECMRLVRVLQQLTNVERRQSRRCGRMTAFPSQE